jgi:alpha-glucosidase
MPFGYASSLERDLLGDNKGNQASPILVSSKGRYLWSEMPCAYRFGAG